MADHRKLAVVSNFVTATVEDVRILVTEDGLQEECRGDLEKIGIRVVIASTKTAARQAAGSPS